MYYNYEWMDVTIAIVSASSTLHRRNLRTQLYFYGQRAYHPQLIRLENGAFRKPEECENAGFSFSFGENKFENSVFQKWWCYGNHVISLTEFSSNRNQTWPVIVTFSNFSGVVQVDEAFIYTPKVFSLCKGLYYWVATKLFGTSLRIG